MQKVPIQTEIVYHKISVDDGDSLGLVRHTPGHKL
jgi:hypothetical protein